MCIAVYNNNICQFSYRDMTGWKPEDPSAEVELPDVMDDDAYADFLADEGLAPRAPGRRRDGRPSSWAIFLALLALASLTGLLWILA